MGTLSAREVDGLLEALDDEYKAWATYDRVIRDFGEVRPFFKVPIGPIFFASTAT